MVIWIPMEDPWEMCKRENQINDTSIQSYLVLLRNIPIQTLSHLICMREWVEGEQFEMTEHFGGFPLGVM